MKGLKLAMAGVGIVLPLTFTAAHGVAQQSASATTTPVQSDKMDQAAIQRSWAIQAQLARIESNKSAFIEELLQSWTPYLDNRIYGDFATELRPIMNTATPWQLYAASLVGDFNTMVQVVRGRMSPGRYVNALSEPQPKNTPRSSQASLGTATGALVFTPIAPCRVVDTRNPGARTGLLSPGVPRTFDLTTDGFGKGQGGSVSCPGLPSFSHYGWSANVTVVGYSNNGGLQAYSFAGPVPSTSIINFFPTAYALANSSTLTGCYGCADDVTMLAFGAPTHVIIDIMGYFEVATGFTNGVVTSLAGPTVNVAAGAFTSSNGGTCPGGTSVIGGGSTNSAFGTMITSDHNISGTHWYEYVKNSGAGTSSWTVFSICMDAP